MTPSSAQCDPALLQRSLNDDLTEQQEERLISHLADCDSCREQLESLAGSRDDWSRVSDVLRTERERQSALLSATSVDAASGVGSVSEERQFVTDFAVDFLQPSDSPDTLGQLDRIEIREVIGHGGNGIVLKGFQPELNRLVAAKVMAPHLATSAAARRRFAREAQATAAIVHPSVLPILSVNSEGRLPYLVMPYVDCESLQQRIDREGSLPIIDVLRIAVQVARGLAAAHAQGLVHRDVKPANILLEKGVDRVMLTDFGLARAIDDASLTRSGLIAGTPQYMSPEQARGDGVDTRSDLFSLGSVLYAMCAGRPPFRAETSYGILRRVTDDEPRPIQEINPETPSWLEHIIRRLLSKSPSERFADAEQLAELLEDCVAHVQQPGVNPLPSAVSEVTQPVTAVSSRRWLPAAGLLGTILIAGVLIVVFLQPTTDESPMDWTNRGTSSGSDESDSASEKTRVWGIPDADEWNSSVEQQLDELDSEIDLLLLETETDWPP